ncbi:MAG: methyl-accepting chemotaxis protein [Burkholderiales bacterium]|nr:methyl-accepting chemotaxis protein [Burkholderiales bacterium]
MSTNKKVTGKKSSAGARAKTVAKLQTKVSIPRSKSTAKSAAASRRQDDLSARMQALNRVQAMIEFDLTGIVLDANDNFLATLGYTRDEIVGQHHSMFVDPAYRASSEYSQFWDKLRRGEFDRGQYRRLGKGGKEVWIEASYNPVLDRSGKPVKVVKFATDITAQKLQQADFEGQLSAISKAQAVIEFSLDGTILNANENFLKVLDYRLEEIKGRHHRMFVEPAEAETAAYRAFWEKLARGEYESARFRRMARGGREVWIQASYNPIFDPSGRAYKVVKYATDITPQVRAEEVLQRAVRDIQKVVQATLAGDLSVRVSMEGLEGTVSDLCGSVNGLVESMGAMISGIDNVVAAAGKGDLRERIQTEGQSGVASSVGKGVNNLIGAMTDIVDRIKSSAEAITTASNEIAAGNLNLSQRTEEQASSLEETASSMEELTQTVKQNADNAKQANQLAAGASDVAQRGGKVVSEVVTIMSNIRESSKKIEDIISVIDGIAFQTNILALNAAVEAARAGEQGRGFAVVAGEVRNLAHRSAAATKEIKGLIGDSVDKVHSGTQLVDTAGKTMGEIVQAVKRVTDIMGEITTASVEQSAGIDQINQAVAQMDQVTQQNAALVEEAATAAAALKDQATDLLDSVAGYRTGKEGRKGAGGVVAAELSSAARRRDPANESVVPLRRTGTDQHWTTF